MDVRLFALPLPHGVPAQALRTLCLAADDAKIRRCRAQPQSEGARLSLAAQTLLRYAAARTLDVPMHAVRVAYLPDGRPILPGTGLYCSVSHTAGLCVCAVAPFPVGADAERIRRPFPPGAAKRVFSASEIAQASGDEDPDASLTRLWTQHESFVKLTGEGLRSIRQPIPRYVCVRSLRFAQDHYISTAVFTDSQ